CAYAWFAYW
nr:immunoglobulin heavy chain junction region [Mus musculus]MBK4195896.1 immunoglobulin heavy chain junction region [Mus musculus]MBK4195897.1 immunoglobulin heavy chain junction region [Mus musculus]